MKNIAIIPARSGSKGLKDKNVKELRGKPLMAYSIEAALESQQFDTVMVSTDSETYADIARKYGAEVPFLRSDINSSDEASSYDLVEEVLTRYKDIGHYFDTFCLLQPTSPLRTARDLIRAYNLYNEKNAIAVVSVCEVEHPLAWCGVLNNEFSLKGFIDRDGMVQRQKQQVFYRINGAIYIADIQEFSKDRFLYREGGYAYVMSRVNSVDIDTEIDFRYAEFLLGNVFQESAASYHSRKS